MRIDATESSSTTIILVIGDVSTIASGPNEVVRRFARWLADHGYDVTIVGTWKGRKPSATELSELYGKARIVIHRRFLKNSWHFAPGIVGYTAKLLLQRRQCVVDAHAVWLFNGLVLLLAAKLGRWKHYFSLHGNLRPVALSKNRLLKQFAISFLMRWVLSSATGLIALNEQEKYEAKRIVPKASIYVMSNGVIPNPSALTSKRKDELLFLGRIDPIKNLEALIDGFSLISKQFSTWKLRIVGPAADCQYLKQLKERSLSRNQENRIIFDGAAYGEEKEKRFLSSSLFALTSLSEGQPMAVLEAMAHGLPVLVSDQCNLDVPESIGRICNGSPESIGRELKILFAMSDDQRQHARSEALGFVELIYSEDRAFSNRLSLYLPPTPSTQDKEAADEKCMLCESREHSSFGFGFLQCNQCGLVVSSNIWREKASETLEQDWFGHIDPIYEQSYWVHRFSERNNRRICAHIRSTGLVTGRMLEIGIGSGSFLAHMKHHGWEVFGCDLSEAICDHANRHYSVPTHCGDVATLPELAEYDLVIMNHVLEHVHKPVEMLVEVRKRMRPGGLLYVTVPNVASWEAQLSGWIGYEPYHLICFSPETATKTVEKAGMSVEKAFTHESFSGWFLAILRTLFNQGQKTAHQRYIERLRRSTSPIEHLYRIGMVTTGLITGPLRLLQKQLGKGDEVIVMARNEENEE